MNKQAKILMQDLNAKIRKLDRVSKATMKYIQQIKDQCILIEEELIEKRKSVAAEDKPFAEKSQPKVIRHPSPTSELQKKFNSMSIEEKMKFIEENPQKK